MQTRPFTSTTPILPEPTAAVLARFLPLLILAPCAASLVWVQATQLLQIPFSLMAKGAVGLFAVVFIVMMIGALRCFPIRALAQDLSWVPLIIICLVFSLLGFVLVRWDADDTHYLSNAVYFLAHPQTKMGFETYYIHVDGPPFRAISWINAYAIEFLLAAFSYILNLDFLSLHWSGKTLIVAFLIPCVWYSLLKRFELRHDAILVAIGTSLLVIFIMGDSFNAYGNWFLTRLFHGKVILVIIGLPLIWTYILDYLDKPNLRDWVALLIISSAMMGLSTMAGFIVPATSATLTLAYCITHKVKIWADMKRLLRLASAFTYLLAATLYIRLHVNPIILQNDSIMNGHYPTNYLGQIAFITNPSFPLSIFIMAVSTVACLKFLSGNNRRLVAWWCALYIGFFLTPLTAPLLIEHLTTSNTYWRLFHGYPIPLVIGITAAGLYSYTRSTTRLRQVGTLTLSGVLLGGPHALLILQVMFGWDRTAPTIIRAIHRVSAGGPRISDIRLADIRAVLPRLPDGPVLAAHPLNSDIPVFSGTHPMIYARTIETEYWFLTHGQPEKGIRRYLATQFASDEYPAGADAFFQVIDEEPNLKSVVIHPDALQLARVQDKLVSKGFEDHGTAGRYRLFIRP